MHPVRTFFHEYEWIHVGLGLIGNLAFLMGSVFFLFESLMRAGAWLFVVGASGMLLGSVGSAVVRYVRQDPHLHLNE